MNNLNSVLIEGNLTKDPDVNRTNNGTFVSTFPLACNRYYKADDELKEEVSFIDIETWGRLAENYLREELHTGALRRGIGNTSIDFALLYADSKERKNMILGEMKYAEHYHHQKYGTTKAGRGKLDLYGPFYYAASSPFLPWTCGSFFHYQESEQTGNTIPGLTT